MLFYIHQDISRDLSAKELADVAAYSEQHFHRIFKDVVGSLSINISVAQEWNTPPIN